MSVSCNTAAHFSTGLNLAGIVVIPVGAADAANQIYHALPATPYPVIATTIGDANCIPSARSTFIIIIT